MDMVSTWTMDALGAIPGFAGAFGMLKAANCHVSVLK
jgi:hypothetical protein